MPAHEGGCFGLAFDALGSKMASCGADKTVKLWDPATATVTSTLHVSASHCKEGGSWMRAAGAAAPAHPTRVNRLAAPGSVLRSPGSRAALGGAVLGLTSGAAALPPCACQEQPLLHDI